jgi:hypothetical protein
VCPIELNGIADHLELFLAPALTLTLTLVLPTLKVTLTR